MLEKFTVSANKFSAALTAAVARWAINGHALVRKSIEENLSGKVLHAKPGGRLFDSIKQVSRVFPDGFQVGTNVNYGIAWEFGFHRGEYTVAPADGRPFASKEYKGSILPAADPRARLRFRSGGEEVFRRSVTVRPQDFEARPFIRPAIEKNMTKLKTMLRKEVSVPMKQMFGGKFVIDIRRIE